MSPPDHEKETATLPRPANDGEPAWDVARLFPNQGQWSEDDYLALDSNRLVEFEDGRIEVLPMPTTSHQEIVAFLFLMVRAYLTANPIGRVLMAPLSVRLRAGKVRQPDLVFMRNEHAHRILEQFWDGADLVMEVVSEDRHRDLVTKRADYAEAGIPEYWIIDPRDQRITVLVLREGVYAAFGEFAPGDRATSALLPGLEIDVTAALNPRP